MDMYVCKEEFKRYSLDARFGDLTLLEIEEYYEYLEDKKLLDGNRNAQHAFLSQFITKFGFSPMYPEETQDYIESSLFSSKMQKCILNIIDGQKGLNDLRKLLESDTNVNDYDTNYLLRIGEVLKEKDEDFLKLFDRYMFALNGEGPRTYIVLKHTPQELALRFLEISNVDPEGKVEDSPMLNAFINYISNMFKIYLPKQRRKYLELLKTNEFENQSDFCQKYTEFVNSDFGKKRKTAFERVQPSSKIKNLIPSRYTTNHGLNKKAM